MIPLVMVLMVAFYKWYVEEQPYGGCVVNAIDSHREATRVQYYSR